MYVEGLGALYVEELRWAGQPRRGAHLLCCPCAPCKVARVNGPGKGDFLMVGIVWIFIDSTKVCCTWRG